MPFNISIDGTADSTGDMKVNATGQVTRIITDDDLAKFGLNDWVLKNYVEKSFGQRPDDCFVRSPTPWNDLYKTYNWSECRTTLRAVRAEILDASLSTTALTSKTFTNDSSVDAVYSADLNVEVANTVEDNWTNTNSITASEAVEISGKIFGVGAKSTTTFSYTGEWSKGGSSSQSVTISGGSGVSVTLKPHQSVIATLNATNNNVKCRVTYEASINGDLAVNYGGTYQGHHFWALGLADTLRANGVSNTVTITEDITIGLFSEGTVEVKDNTAAKLQFHIALPKAKLNLKRGAARKLIKGIPAPNLEQEKHSSNGHAAH